MHRLIVLISLIAVTLPYASCEGTDTRQRCIAPSFKSLTVSYAGDMYAPPVTGDKYQKRKREDSDII